MSGNDFLERLKNRVSSTVTKATAEQEERDGPRCKSDHLFVAEAEVAAQLAEDDGTGKVKKPRVEARLTLVDVLGPFAGEWGDRWAYKYHQEGTCNVLMWWTSSKSPVEKGQTDLLKFTVDKHEVYEGVKQTKITRVTTVKAEVEAAKKRRKKNQDEGKNDDGTDRE